MTNLFLLLYFLCGGGLVLASIVLGFRMGRQSVGINPPPKPAESKPVDMMTEDPYFEAMAGQETARIPTVQEEK